MLKITPIIATFGYIGHIRYASGTWGSFAGLFLYISMYLLGIPLWLLGLLGMVWVGSGIVCSEHYAKEIHELDPKSVVIDEVAGQWITCLMIAYWIEKPYVLCYFFLGFVFFRILDILKPGPIGWVDSTLSGGIGIMADDILAGIGAGAIACLLWNWEQGYFLSSLL